MGTRKIKYNSAKIKDLPNDQSVLYRIETKTGNSNYVGVARRGQVQDQIEEHLGEIPGATVKIEQFASIKDARSKAANIIKRNPPKYNK